ncbi:MAG: Rne/Rng family ribonuclease [Rhodospirillales bacterium]|nr:Rne/Rng family ribonuclease [Rhodospirillales bacterium]
MATKRMLIDATHLEETRVVVVDGNRLEDLDVESASKKQLKGNIYLAKVTRVEPSLQAAFVDYGGNRHGFLPFSEIHPDYYQIPIEDREELIAGEENEAQRDEAEVDKEAEAKAASSEGESEAEGPVEDLGGDDEEETDIRRRTRTQKRYKIQEVIKRRQIVLIQVVKEERGNKGAALTTYISLAGRHCVLMPNTARGGGISRKITSVQDRRRLKSVLAELSIPKGMAIIVRTAGAERSKAEIRRDYEYLVRLWNTVREMTLDSTAPCIVYEEGNLIKRSIRDLYSRDIDEIIVEGDKGYRTAKDFMKMLIPSHSKKVQPYQDTGMSLFHRYQVEGQLDAMHSATVQLRSGGYIVINPTEALVAIDVNSGKATRERNIEETAFKTNLESADEIARQLKLRDLAGLIVIDFIDMENNRNQSNVERRLKDAMRHDRARIQIGRISPFGLMEMSRQRLRPSILETSSEVCPHCEGTGVRRSIDSTALHVLRAIEEEGIKRRTTEMRIQVPSSVALYILNQKRSNLTDIEARHGLTVEITANDELIPPAYNMEKLNNQAPTGLDTPVVAESVEPSAPEPTTEPQQEQEEENGKRRRRRPRRRRKPQENRIENNGETENQEPTEAPATVSDENRPVEETAQPGTDEDQPKKRRRRGRRGGRKRNREEFEENIKNTSETKPVESVETPSEENVPVVEAKEEVVTEETSVEAAPQAPETSEPTKVEDKTTEGEEEKPKRRAPRTRKKTTDGEEKPRRRRTRKKADEETETTTTPAAEPSESSTEEVVEKPKRTRRRAPRKKVASKEIKVETVEISPAPQETEVKVAVAPPAPTPVPAPEPVQAEAPVEEAVVPFVEKPVTVMKSGQEEEVSADKPVKKGWWRR